jgi:tRNA(Ile)-lysidine synthase TilS/MesJ
MDEQPRPDANGDEQAYTLTIDEALQRYEAAGHPRTPRAIQKYCQRGDLEWIKEETEYGQRYRITPASVARHIAQIEEIKRANVRDRSRKDASVRTVEIEAPIEKTSETNVREQPRPDANVPPPPAPGEEARTATNDGRYVQQLERENAYLREQNDKKDQQLERRDRQIEAMIERDRETNILIKGLQERIPQLAQSSERYAPGDNP